MQTSSIGFKRTYAGTSIPVFQLDKAFDLVQGGFTLTKTGWATGLILYRGTPLLYDEIARTAVLLHTGLLFANASNSDTTYQVQKGHSFLVGDYLASVVGGKAYAIIAIDTSNSDHDVLTVGTTLAVALTAGALLFASTATGASAAALPACNGLLYEETVISETAYTQAVSAVKRATVYARRVPYNTSIAALTGLSHIIYSQSY